MKKNSGFALIELVVSLAIMGIVGLVLFEFIAISSKTFRSVNTEVNLQYESQLTINQLKDLIVDSNRGVVYGLQTVAGGFTEVDLTLPNAETIQIQNLETAEAANVGTLKRCLLIYNQKTEGAVTNYPVIKIVWDPATKKLMYAERTFTDLTVLEADRYLSSLLETDYEVMSAYINSFSVILSNAQDRIFDIKMDLSSSKSSYSSNASIALRNKVVVSSDLNAIYTEVNIEKPNMINGVAIKKGGTIISTDTVSVGQTVTYEADVDVQFGATTGSEAVKWVLAGNSTYGAGAPTTLSQTGELNVSAYELSTLLTVTAVSIADSSKKAVINIVVEDGRGEFGYVNSLAPGVVSEGNVINPSTRPYKYYGIQFTDSNITYVNKDKIPVAERGVTWEVVTDVPQGSDTWEIVSAAEAAANGVSSDCPFCIKVYYGTLGKSFAFKATTKTANFEGEQIATSTSFMVSGMQVPVEVTPTVSVDLTNNILSRNGKIQITINSEHLFDANNTVTIDTAGAIGFGKSETKKTDNIYLVKTSNPNVYDLYAKTQMNWNTYFKFRIKVVVSGQTNLGNPFNKTIYKDVEIPKVIMTLTPSDAINKNIRYDTSAVAVLTKIEYLYLETGDKGKINQNYYPTITLTTVYYSYNNNKNRNKPIDVSSFISYNTAQSNIIIDSSLMSYINYNDSTNDKITFKMNALDDNNNTLNTLSQDIIYTFTN